MSTKFLLNRSILFAANANDSIGSSCRNPCGIGREGEAQVISRRCDRGLGTFLVDVPHNHIAGSIGKVSKTLFRSTCLWLTTGHSARPPKCSAAPSQESVMGLCPAQ